MLVDKSQMSVIDLSRFKNELHNRTYGDFCIKTKSYVLMRREMFEKLFEIARKHGENPFPERYWKDGKPVKE